MIKDDGRFARTNLKKAHLSYAHLEGADLRNANLVEAELDNAHLENYIDTFNKDKEGGCMRKSEGLMGLSWLSSKKDPKLNDICGWFRSNMPEGIEAKSLQPKFCEAANSDVKGEGELHLSNSHLTGADLTDANLTDADLTNANLTDATGMTKEQISAAGRLCNTTLPPDIPDAQSLRNRDCSKRKPPASNNHVSAPLPCPST